MFKDRAVKIIRSFKVNRVSKIILLLIFCISIFGIFGQTKADTISDKQAELDNLQQQINNYSSIISQKQQEAGSLQAQIAMIDASLSKTKVEIEKTQTNIDKNQLEIDDTQAKINDKQKEMDKKKDVLKACIQTTYEQGKQSTLEMLVSSDNLSDFMDQVEYVSVVEDKTKGIYDEVKQIKDQLTKYRKDLDNKRQELVKLKDEKETEQNNLQAQIANKQTILDKTNGEEASYQNMLSQANEQARQAQSEIAAAFGSDLTGGGSGYYGSGNYPWTDWRLYPSSCADPWGFYYRQCTSYAAWKWSTVGRQVTWRGDAREWAGNARARGYTVNTNPTIGCIMVYTGGDYGHVAYVEDVRGGQIKISDYNRAAVETYGEMWTSASGKYYIH